MTHAKLQSLEATVKGLKHLGEVQAAQARKAKEAADRAAYMRAVVEWSNTTIWLDSIGSAIAEAKREGVRP